MTDIQFHYKAMDGGGNVKEGIKKTANEFDLKRDLKNEGLTLLRAEAVGKFSLTLFVQKVLDMGSISMHEKIVFNRNLGAMIGAGLALSRSLEILQRQTKNKKFKRIIAEINEKIKKGSSLAQAMKDYPQAFSILNISMVQTGEESGRLVESLQTISDQMEKQHNLNKKIKGAMVYPGVIMGVMVLVAIFMLFYIVPTLTATFTELDIDLPASTQFIINFSNFVQNNVLASLIIFLILIVAVYLMKKSAGGRRFFDWLFLHIPTVADLTKEINSARTARTMASLLSSGVPFVRALQITGNVVQNSYFKAVIVQAEKNVELGFPMSKVFGHNAHLYPIFVAEMIAVGEETGDLSSMLSKVAVFYENEVEQKTKNLSTIVEPFLMVVVGAAVGFFAISMISPMYSLVDSL